MDAGVSRARVTFLRIGRLARRLGLMAALCGLVAGVAGAVALELMIENGFSARDEPTFVDTFIARWWRRLAVPGEERGARNPLPPTAEVLARGREHFVADCAVCHGSDGRGGTRLGSGLYPKPSDLTSAAMQSLSDGEIFWVVHNGVRLSGMPAWGRDGEERDQWTWEIVHLIRALPRMSPEEVEAMRGMQPSNPRDIEEEMASRRFLGEPVRTTSAPEDAHHEATLMGSVIAIGPLRLQVRPTAGPNVSFLLDHPVPTKFVDRNRPTRPAAVRVGDRVVVQAVRDQDWWLAREVRVSRATSPP